MCCATTLKKRIVIEMLMLILAGQKWELWTYSRASDSGTPECGKDRLNWISFWISNLYRRPIVNILVKG